MIDVGNVYRVQQALQASTDAAAAAGAGQLTLQYPREHRQRDHPGQELLVGNRRAQPDHRGSRDRAYRHGRTSCVGSNSNLPCNNANTVTVTQSASVPTYFLQRAWVKHHRRLDHREGMLAV